jgi:hypothetical protein
MGESKRKLIQCKCAFTAMLQGTGTYSVKEGAVMVDERVDHSLCSLLVQEC